MVSGSPVYQKPQGPVWSGRDIDGHLPPTVSLREVILHEFRTPLAVARSALELLRSSADAADGETARLIGWVELGLLWVERLVESIPAWTAVITGDVVLHRRLITVRDWVEPALDLVAPLLAARDQQLRYICAVPVAPVWGDPCWLQQAVVNLLTNAIRHGPRGDTIEVAVRSGRTKVEVRVTDHGAGVSPRQAQRLFQPYVTGRPDSGGKGLGLYLVRRVAELHGGSVGVSSRPGEATTFRLAIPAAGHEPPEGGAQKYRRL
jgi:signal transduction histidine kinase